VTIYGSECTHYLADAQMFCGAWPEFAQYAGASETVTNVFCAAHRDGACQRIPPRAPRADRSTMTAPTWTSVHAHPQRTRR